MKVATRVVEVHVHMSMHAGHRQTRQNSSSTRRFHINPTLEHIRTWTTCQLFLVAGTWLVIVGIAHAPCRLVRFAAPPCVWCLVMTGFASVVCARISKASPGTIFSWRVLTSSWSRPLWRVWRDLPNCVTTSHVQVVRDRAILVLCWFEQFANRSR